ncbi:MAG: 6,7-dimethyl-8-ribityllumazine synthase [Pseudomonadota bacterium]
MAAADASEDFVLPHFERSTRVLFVVAPFYTEIAEHLLAGARAAVEASGASGEAIYVPGALEIPPAIALAATSGNFAGYVALGCVIRGETSHYETVCNDSSRGLMLLGLRGLCIGNGILTVEDRDQALVRARPDGKNKGGGAAEACLHLMVIKGRFAPASSQEPDAKLYLAGEQGPNGSFV